MIKTVTMANGLAIPVLGFGTFKAADGEEAYQSTLAAIKAGYRHIDTAAIYHNEKVLDRPFGIRAFLVKSSLLPLSSGMMLIAMMALRQP